MPAAHYDIGTVGGGRRGLERRGANDIEPNRCRRRSVFAFRCREGESDGGGYDGRRRSAGRGT